MSTEFELCQSQVIYPVQQHQSWAEFLKMPPGTPKPSAPPLSPEQSPMSQIHAHYNNCNRTNQNNDNINIDTDADEVFYSPRTVIVDTPVQTPRFKSKAPQRLHMQPPKYEDINKTTTTMQIYCNICYKYVSIDVAPNRRVTSKGQWCGNCNRTQFDTKESIFTFENPCEYCDSKTAVYELVTVKFYGNTHEVCGQCFDTYGRNYPHNYI